MARRSQSTSCDSVINLPNNWQPRGYQKNIWVYLEGGGKRAIAIWHRRSGKDDVGLHWTAVDAIQNPGTYWYMLPEASQARKAIWEAINPHTGIRRIDEAFPHEIRATTREQEMMIKFVGGSTWQVVGSDNYDSLVGSPPRGVVFSEWPMSIPSSWAYLRPIFLENGGWAIFNGTPRGMNHAHVMFQAAKDDPEWFAELLTADDTGVFTPEQLRRERDEYVREHGEDVGDALFKQEYYCSFQAAIMGAFYAKEMAAMEKDGRITFVPHDPGCPVSTSWDMGLDGHMAVTYIQHVGLQRRFIDFTTGVGALPDTVREVMAKPYTYDCHYMPHDAEPDQIGSGKSMKETAESLGMHNIIIVPQGSVADGINEVRKILPSVAIDKDKCAHLIKALLHYQREWNEKLNTFKSSPRHDWASHPADSVRTYAMGYEAAAPEIDYRKIYSR